MSTWVIVIIVLFAYFDLSSKIEGVKQICLRLKKSQKKESPVMSVLINDLKGKRCIISSDISFGWEVDSDLHCEIVDSDEEWVNIKFKTKKDIEKNVFIKIEDIEKIELI